MVTYAVRINHGNKVTDQFRPHVPKGVHDGASRSLPLPGRGQGRRHRPGAGGAGPWSPAHPDVMNFPIVLTSARASAVSSGHGFTDEDDDAGRCHTGRTQGE